MRKNFLVISILLFAGALSVQAIWLQRVFSEAQLQFSDRVNLALRETAHELLKSIGDTTSTIPPVQQDADNAWLLRLNHAFDYECLPPLLTMALKNHAIEGNYEVGIYDCQQNNLILGYAASTSNEEAPVACKTREQPFSCFYLKLMFTDRHVVPFSESSLRLVAILALLMAIVAAAWLLLRRKKRPNHQQHPSPLQHCTSAGRN
ncbi:MAG: hypothetical protein IPL65_00040 [Lewinellaceae bacterium]|nr:hypothetical protein [Lewinellaceae bacterium]